MGIKQESRLEALEREFVEALYAALRRCARGAWGLFGQNDAVIAGLGKQMRKFPEVNELLELGEKISELRNKLGLIEPFAPYARFLATRQMKGPNVPGEPKLARQWLKDLGLE